MSIPVTSWKMKEKGLKVHAQSKQTFSFSGFKKVTNIFLQTSYNTIIIEDLMAQLFLIRE